MKSLLKLSILPLALVVVSCNEKISPELQNAGATGATEVTAPPSEYYFRLVSSAPTLLNQYLHRTGAGNYATNCTINNGSVALTADLYQTEAATITNHDQKSLDITCYLEAEELGMYFNGLSYQIEASSNTCDYIGYQPFSYFDRMPGDSTATYEHIECDSTAQSHAGLAAFIQTSIPNAKTDVAAATNITCGEYVDTTVALGSRAVRTVIDTENELCSFDYTRDVTVDGQEVGKNCDIGDITIKLSTISVNGAALQMVSSNKRIKCGGKASNCIRGPILQAQTLQGLTRGTEITQAVQGSAYSNKYDLEPLIKTKRNGSYEYANFRRNLAAIELDYIDFSDPVYDNIFPTAVEKKDFNPDVMEFYSANQYLNSVTPLISSAEKTAAATVNGWTARHLASEPFMGFGTSRTNPFYTFICYDKAFDKKAQIRMVVRDWDRNFAVTSALEQISDYKNIFPATNTDSRMDNPRDFEVPGSPQTSNQYNDLNDFDDLVFMERNAGAFTAGITYWRPMSTVVVPYPNGFFDPINFTNGNF